MLQRLCRRFAHLGSVTALHIWKKTLLSALILGLAAPLAASGQPPVGSGEDPQNQAGAADPALTTSEPLTVNRSSLSDTEQTALKSALAAARASDRPRFDAALSLIQNPDARHIATWAMVDTSGEQMSFFELDQARRDLAGWPRGARRQALTEKALAAAGLSPQDVIAWFGDDRPVTGEGALTLASGLAAKGRTEEAQFLVRNAWRNQVFEADVQAAMLDKFGAWLTPEDHIKRADMLLYGTQGPAAKAMLPLLPPDERRQAEARIALRANARKIDLSGLETVPGVAFERMAQLRRSDQVQAGLAAAKYLGPAPGFDEGDARNYSERRQMFVEALKIQDWRGAYDTMKDAGFRSGERKAESDFFAGWIALTKLNDPIAAEHHFQGVREAGRTPLTQARADYWLGRAEEAQGRVADAQRNYFAGSQFIGAFYGQLAAEKAGITTITLPPEPQPTAADRARFEGRDMVRAARLLAECGEDGLFKVFVTSIGEGLPSAEEYALLMDMARNYNQPFLAMMAGRAAAGKGFLLPERMYPLRDIPTVPNPPEAAFVMAITRQESSFDPKIRSSADARGMMMLLPSTASQIAKRMGVGYSAAQLYDADYNMRLGTYHLGELINSVQGSFILTAVAYNAGPGRVNQWTTFCGDPRGGTDPLNFIECAPFTETRNYMMRVMENVAIYRARLNGGAAPLSPSADLNRGGYTYALGPMPPPQAQP
jgi:soluble lytic murein transglycosylase